jgi:hypothetical protein
MNSKGSQYDPSGSNRTCNNEGDKANNVLIQNREDIFKKKEKVPQFISHLWFSTSVCKNELRWEKIFAHNQQ